MCESVVAGDWEETRGQGRRRRGGGGRETLEVSQRSAAATYYDIHDTDTVTAHTSIVLRRQPTHSCEVSGVDRRTFSLLASCL